MYTNWRHLEMIISKNKLYELQHIYIIIYP